MGSFFLQEFVEGMMIIERAHNCGFRVYTSGFHAWVCSTLGHVGWIYLNETFEKLVSALLIFHVVKSLVHVWLDSMIPRISCPLSPHYS
jgi:hypothetical protein